MKTKRYKVVVLGTVLCLVVFAGFAVFSKMQHANAGEEGKNHLMRPIPTAVVTIKAGGSVREFPGIVKARKDVQLAFSVEGLLEKLDAQEGESVFAGEVVGVLDQRDFIHNVEAAEANFSNLQTELKRTASLREKEVVSQAEFDAIRTKYDIALAELKIRKKALEDTVLLAPFDGVIAKRHVENNEHVAKHAPIVTLKDLREMEVTIRIPENLMAKKGIKPFTGIEVKFDSSEDGWHPAWIREYSVEANVVTRTYDVAIGFTLPEGTGVLPGMTASAKITFSENSGTESGEQKIYLVPVQAVFSTEKNRSYVWIIPEEGGLPEKKEIAVGPMENDCIEIQGDITVGMRVATAGVHSLHSEMLVRPMVNGGEGLGG